MTRRAELAMALEAIAAELESAPTRAEQLSAKEQFHHSYQLGALQHITRSNANAIRAVIRAYLERKAA